MSEHNRFVLLHHSLAESEHWDLMLEAGSALATWQIAHEPSQLTSGQPVLARRLADHRLAYLDYEGEVSGNRGHVSRADSGVFDRIESADTTWAVRLNGRLLNGVFRFTRDEQSSDGWYIQRLRGSGSMPNTSEPV